MGVAGHGKRQREDPGAVEKLAVQPGEPLFSIKIARPIR
jgi:hypothetical protein